MKTKKHSAKKVKKFAAHRSEAKAAKATAAANSHISYDPPTYAEEKAENRAPALAAKEARVAKKALLAAMLPPGARAPSLAPSGLFERQCPYARRRGGRNRAYMKSARGYRKARANELGMQAHRAQLTIERVFKDKAGMSWSDVARGLKAKKWSWKEINFLAMHKGIGAELTLATAVEKQREAA